MELKYQENEDSEIVCCSCVHNIRCPEKGDLANIKCYCEIDNHYIGYISCMSNYCDNWERSTRLLDVSQLHN